MKAYDEILPVEENKAALLTPKSNMSGGITELGSKLDQITSMFANMDQKVETLNQNLN